MKKPRNSKPGNVRVLSGLTAVLIAVFFFALAGIPPLAGWFAKFVMFRAVIGAFASPWAVALAVIAAVNAVIALYYYARVVKSVFMDDVPVTIPQDTAAEMKMAPSLTLAIGLTAAVTLLVGLYPQALAFFGEAARAFGG